MAPVKAPILSCEHIDLRTKSVRPAHAVFAASRYMTPKGRTFLDLAVQDFAN